MASTIAKRRIVSKALAVLRSGETMNLHRQPINPAFQPFLDRSEGPLERRTGFVHGNFSNDAAFQTRQPSLLRTFKSDQIEAAVGMLLIAYANRQIQSRLEVVARVKLLHSNGIGRIRRTGVTVDDGLHNPKGWLESKTYLLPIKLGLDVS